MIRRLGTALVAALLVTGVADAALTTPKCLAGKRKVWGTFRACEIAARAKALAGKTADLASCSTKLAERLAKADGKAAKAAIPCRYGNNGDLTITDYDSGLQWEGKTGIHLVGLPGFTCPQDDSHCVSIRYNQYNQAPDFLAVINGTSLDGTTPIASFAGHRDWRLPTIDELRGILDLSVPGCGVDPACIDPTFGPTAAALHCTSTVDVTNTERAWYLSFADGSHPSTFRLSTAAVRFVRSAL